MNVFYIVLCTAAFFATAFVIVYLISVFYYHRSVMATLAEWYLRIIRKDYSDEDVIKGIPYLPEKNDVRLSVPNKLKRRYVAEESSFGCMQVVTVKGNDNCIIYLHGSGYVRPPRPQHWRMVGRLAEQTGATVIFPIYPKAPNHTCKEVYALMKNFYVSVAKNFNKVILAGDSSGGGLALGLVQEFKEENVRMPDELILLSPWVDVSLENPDLAEREKYDGLVSIDNERIWGKCWAGDYDVKHPRVSPLFGDLNGLCAITIFVGTREVLYPDIIKLYNKLKDCKAEVSLYKGSGLNHGYPLYPIPEAEKALKIIVGVVKNSSKIQKP